MRILHTSDWHLGRTFHGTSLHATAELLMDELVEFVREQAIDVLMISGDVYDQAQPRTETVQLFDRTLTRIIQSGTQVVAISGNHDSAVRLGFGASLFSSAGVYLVTSQTQVGTPILIEAGGVTVAFYGIPYLEPRPIAARWGTEPTHAGVLAEAMCRVEKDAVTRQADATVVLAHCFAGGAVASESERDISVGGVEQAPVSLFSQVTYTALGHLHGKQKLTDTVRYSGSLLAYSFSEQNHRKGAWILDIDSGGDLTVTEYTWKTKLVLKTLRGTLEEVLSPQNTADYGQAFVSITLTDSERPAHALDQLKTYYDHVQELYFDPQGAQPRQQHIYRRAQTNLSPQEICESFYHHVRGRQLTEEENNYLATVIETARTQGHAE